MSSGNATTGNQSVRKFLARLIARLKKNYRRAKVKRPIIINSCDLVLIVNNKNRSRSFTAQRIGALLRERDDLIYIGPGQWEVVVATKDDEKPRIYIRGKGETFDQYLEALRSLKKEHPNDLELTVNGKREA